VSRTPSPLGWTRAITLDVQPSARAPSLDESTRRSPAPYFPVEFTPTKAWSTSSGRMSRDSR